jgi:hypothetical protein
MIITYAPLYTVIIRYGGGRAHAYGRYHGFPLPAHSRIWDCPVNSLHLMSRTEQRSAQAQFGN